MKTEIYFHPIRDAIQSLSLSQVVSTVERCRAHCAQKAKEEGELSTHESRLSSCVKLHTHSVIESRDENDLTVLMYACLLYYSKARENDRMACRALDQICGWLVEQGATVWAQGCRRWERVGTRNGRPVYGRTGGKNIVEALGQANLPPTIQKYIAETNSEIYNRFDQRIVA